MKNQTKEGFKSLILRWYENRDLEIPLESKLKERDALIKSATEKIVNDYKEYADEQTKLTKEKASLEVLIRRYARIRYIKSERRESQVLQGLGIKLIERFEYKVADAVEWCIKGKFHNLLTLASPKAFEAIARQHLLSATSFITQHFDETSYFESKNMLKRKDENLKNLEKMEAWFIANSEKPSLEERLQDSKESL